MISEVTEGSLLWQLIGWKIPYLFSFIYILILVTVDILVKMVMICDKIEEGHTTNKKTRMYCFAI